MRTDLIQSCLFHTCWCFNSQGTAVRGWSAINLSVHKRFCQARACQMREERQPLDLHCGPSLWSRLSGVILFGYGKLYTSTCTRGMHMQSLPATPTHPRLVHAFLPPWHPGPDAPLQIATSALSAAAGMAKKHKLHSYRSHHLRARCSCSRRNSFHSRLPRTTSPGTPGCCCRCTPQRRRRHRPDSAALSA